MTIPEQSEQIDDIPEDRNVFRKFYLAAKNVTAIPEIAKNNKKNADFRKKNSFSFCIFTSADIYFHMIVYEQVLRKV